MTVRLRLWPMVCRTSAERDWHLLSPVRADENARRQCADHDGAALQQARRKKETTYPELASPRGGRARLVVLGCETRVRRGQRFRESAGESEVPQATPTTADVSKTRMVPPVEHSVGLQRCSVLRPLASGAPRRFWHRPLTPLRPQSCLRSSDKSVETSELATCAACARPFF